MAVGSDRLHDFARRYTEAWCSHDPARVAEHYAADGSLTINGGIPSVGRAAITEAAQSFMTAFPDLQVLMDDVLDTGETAEYHWTLVGTNTGPGGTGKRVRISGFEEWTIGDDGLIAASQGHFDQAEYDRQLEHGAQRLVTMAEGCEIVRSGDAQEGAQRLLYAPGVTSATAGTTALCLTSAELPVGARSACHLHRSIESAGFVASGKVEVWWGKSLESHAVLEAGDFAYIPPDLPHVVGNAGDGPARIVVAHSSASDQDGIELLPDLDPLLDH